MTMRIGVLPLARPTFDVPYAEEMAAKAFATLDSAGIQTVGPRELLFDAAARGGRIGSVRQRAARFRPAAPSDVHGCEHDGENRRASHRAARHLGFSRAARRWPPAAECLLRAEPCQACFGPCRQEAAWLYAAPDATEAASDILAMVRGGQGIAGDPVVRSNGMDSDAERLADAALAAIRGSRIGLVGEHPLGFDTCRYEPADLDKLIGVAVEPIHSHRSSIRQRPRAAPMWRPPVPAWTARSQAWPR